MIEEAGRPIKVPKSKLATFRALTDTPKLAVPTVVLACVLIPGVFLVDVLAVSGRLSLTIAASINILLYYFFFSIIHDGVHRAISSNKALNDLICQIAISVYAPFAAMPLFRWAHMEHHRFTNDERDPDAWSHGAWWSLPFRWMLIDFNYGYRALTSSSPAVKKVVRDSLPFIIGGIAVLAVIIALGYGFELFVLWFIPTRLAFIGIGFSFFWLPHAHWPDEKVNLKQADNFTIATTLRLGHERILNPLLQYQNFHLIHHLWPTTPFYNNERVWKLLEEDLRVRDLAIARGFHILPAYEFAASQPTEARHA
jgi:beta-carotene hydroxylase